MTVFPAIVPAGTLLYRGSPKNTTLHKSAWLSFEPEHALWHAAGRIGRDRALQGLRVQQEVTETSVEQQVPLDGVSSNGWLVTYATSRPLRLIYLDGLSAAKSVRGTLDLQDFLILDYDMIGLESKANDYRRASDLCDVIKDRWAGSVDGFIRAELGFEVILCNPDAATLHSAVNGKAKGYDVDDYFHYWQAALTGSHALAGDRVHVGSPLFTMFDTDEDLFSRGMHPRLLDVPRTRLAEHRTRLDGRILQHDWEAPTHMAWQFATDAVVSRYARALQHMTTMQPLDVVKIQRQARILLGPFAGGSPADSADTIGRCVHHSVHAIASTSSAYSAVYSVVHRICSDLVALQDEQQIDAAQSRLGDLTDYLSWSTWRECPSCELDEVCFTPIYPLGDEEDAVSPSCVSADTLAGRQGYCQPPPIDAAAWPLPPRRPTQSRTLAAWSTAERRICRPYPESPPRS
ncbi:hypothetical protein ANO11243_080640 [Dothideomycetidae sp. 11243]|nr:hypothetical protein ANO11243_080640 [fungal sp. No.11243]